MTLGAPLQVPGNHRALNPRRESSGKNQEVDEVGIADKWAFAFSYSFTNVTCVIMHVVWSSQEAQERAADILVEDKRKSGQGGKEVWKCGRSVRVPRVTG